MEQSAGSFSDFPYEVPTREKIHSCHTIIVEKITSVKSEILMANDAQ